MDDLTKLTGIGQSSADKMYEQGFYNFMNIATTTASNLSSLTGISETKCRKMIMEAREKVQLGFNDGDVIETKRNSITKLPFNFESFDSLLGGGVECGSITEVFGAFSSGKSQLSHLLCASMFKEYPGSHAIYIDSENCFRPERIRDFCNGFEINPDDCLKHVKHALATNTDHQMLLVNEVEKLIAKGLDVKLIIVDSLTSHFRSEYQGRGTLAARQQKLNAHMHDLMKIAMIYDVAVFITNQVQKDPGTFYGNPEKSIGGCILEHNSSSRLHLRRGVKGSRVAKLIDSPHLPDGEVMYFITGAGLSEKPDDDTSKKEESKQKK